MKIHFLACTIAALQLFPWSPAHAQTTGVQERSGLSCISSKPFVVPEGSKALSAFSADFENGALPQGWGKGMGEVVTAPDAPQGKAYFRMPAKKGAWLGGPAAIAQGGAPYFISYWIKAPLEPWPIINFTSDERVPSYNPLHFPFYYQVPPADSWNQWRQMGFYFWMPAQCKTIQFSITPRNESPDGFICIDDIRLRTSTFAEMSAAYKAERKNYPPYNVTPAPGDGKNLALSIAKWEGKAGIPGKPFVIWAMGSSYTDMQSGGEAFELMDAIRQRYPKAPPIIYRQHEGPGTPWDFVYAWTKQSVEFEAPDMIFTYTSGTLDGLDAMLTEIRRHTTADVIVPSLHFKPPCTMSPDDIARGMGVVWDKAREICEKHGAEFVDNRREMAQYIADAKLVPDDLLLDHNHQNVHGRVRIWDNIFAHLNKSSQPAFNPEALERRIAVNPAAKTATEQVSLSGNWSKVGGAIRSSTAGDRLKINFTGNRIELLGLKAPAGGSVKVLIDGVAGDQLPLVYTDFVKPGPHNRGSNWRSPHMVGLGADPVPQTWTITMTSETGDYSVEGSVTGPDGTGNLTQPFVSKSGQISIDPKFWREGHRAKEGPDQYGNVTGDSFSFDVIRAAAGEISFNSDQASLMAEPLARNLANGPHTLELITTGNGKVAIDGFYVYQPPEKE